MNRWVKRILIGLGVVAGVLLIALGALVGYGEAAFGRTYERDLYPIEADTSPEGVARGEYLVKHVVACSGCHAERLGGPLTGRVEEVAIGPMRMTLVFPNLTPDEETGLGSWSDAEIARAIREGLDREGRELYIMPSQQLRVLSNADVAAIVGYLRTLEPVRNPLPPLSANALAKPMLAMHLMVPGAVSEPITEAQVAPEPSTVEYGEYLVWLGLRTLAPVTQQVGVPRGQREHPAARRAAAGDLAHHADEVAQAQPVAAEAARLERAVQTRLGERLVRLVEEASRRLRCGLPFAEHGHERLRPGQQLGRGEVRLRRRDLGRRGHVSTVTIKTLDGQGAGRVIR